MATDTEFQNIEVHGGVPTMTDADPDGIWTLYEGPKKCDCHINWVTEMPEDVKLQLSKENEEIEAGMYAMIIRKKRTSHDDLFPKVRIHNITVQSKLLAKVIKELFNNYRGIYLDENMPVLVAPFMPFYHHWNRWQERLEKQEDGRTKNHMKLLDSILREELAPAFEARKQAFEGGAVSWEHLWKIFSPDQLVYHHDGQYDRIYRVVSISERSLEKLEVTTGYGEYNGRYFAKASKVFSLDLFEGTKKIKELPIYPLECCDDPAALQEELFKRGEMALKYTGVHCLDYQGLADSGLVDGFQSSTSSSHKGRIIVDTYSWRKGTNVDYLKSLSKYDKLEDHEVARATAGDQQFTFDVVCRLSPYIRGWSLARNQWMSFGVDKVSAPAWKTEAFSQLSLPEEFRELIQATVEMQLRRDSVFDDFVPGKGQGFVMLLSGPPGVGKTATIETIAEALQLPLYILSAANLGSKASEVEEKLQAEFNKAKRWKAILLLDEADIFLEARTSASDVRRNAIVAVFLRLIEYQSGVLCLTTNRPDCIDPAVQSRVHLSLRYPELGPETREKIWRQFAASNAKAQAETQKRKADKAAADGSEASRSSKRLKAEGDVDSSINICDRGEESDPDSNDVFESVSDGQGEPSVGGADDDDDHDRMEEDQSDAQPDLQLGISDEEFAELARTEIDGRQIKNVFKTATLLAEYNNKAVDFASLQRSLQIVQKHMNKTF